MYIYIIYIFLICIYILSIYIYIYIYIFVAGYLGKPPSQFENHWPRGILGIPSQPPTFQLPWNRKRCLYLVSYLGQYGSMG